MDKKFQRRESSIREVQFNCGYIANRPRSSFMGGPTKLTLAKSYGSYKIMLSINHNHHPTRLIISWTGNAMRAHLSFVAEAKRD